MSEEFLYRAKYHLLISNRLIRNFYASFDKKFVVASIRELAKSASNLIKWSLMKKKCIKKDYKKNLLSFSENFKGLVGEKTCNDILRILEVEKALRKSPITYTRKKELILLDEGSYRFLKPERLKEFELSIERGIRLLESFFADG